MIVVRQQDNWESFGCDRITKKGKLVVYAKSRMYYYINFISNTVGFWQMLLITSYPIKSLNLICNTIFKKY